ncbi:peptide chain release factor N(5)-glutamine methyltransferase [Algiphilus sp.]|uniref:peptide chain release factor N(5)-glutamine methyltransferase n=2 Tax=Algiphilus sp. TaxID=1872431 RepID=UPI0025BAC91B|nr:peptide chain release factor N(5)-glutamine methyltransferase [Algiphilus sp.]
MMGDGPSETVGQLLRAARDRLGARSESAGLDAELLLAAALGKPRSFLYAWPDHVPTASVRERFDHALTDRLEGQPVAYTLGVREFFGLELAVSPAVLIPRPDTELLVEHAVAHIDAGHAVADLGTGSGAIALAVAHERPGARVLATDASPAALAVARANARRLDLRVDLVAGDWCAPLADASVDCLLCNPPYIAEGDPHLAALSAEPASALVSGRDGLDALRAIVAQAPRVLRPGGRIVLEHGFEQAAAVRALLAEAGFRDIDSERDLGGHERISFGRLRD